MKRTVFSLLVGLICVTSAIAAASENGESTEPANSIGAYLVERSCAAANADYGYSKTRLGELLAEKGYTLNERRLGVISTEAGEIDCWHIASIKKDCGLSYCKVKVEHTVPVVTQQSNVKRTVLTGKSPGATTWAKSTISTIQAYCSSARDRKLALDAQKPSGCISDSDCKSDRICVSGKCKAPQGSSKIEGVITMGCTRNVDCGGNFICIAGFCIPPPPSNVEIKTDSQGRVIKIQP